MERNRSAEGTMTRTASGAAVMRNDVTDALTSAFFSEWSRVGYADLSLERVARAAGSGKAALYRRWSDKASMAADLLPRAGLAITDVADTGSIESDLKAMLLAIRRVLRHMPTRRILMDLHAELGRNPALAQVVRPFQDARRARAIALVDRAITRGDLKSGVDRELAADLLAAPLYWRMAVLGRRADMAYVGRLVEAIMAALLATRE